MADSARLIDALETALERSERERTRAEARVEQLTEAINHVVTCSPGTPDSVKQYLRRAVLVGDSTPGINPERPPEHVFEEFREMHGVGDSE